MSKNYPIIDAVYAELLAIDSDSQDERAVGGFSTKKDVPWWFALVVSASQQLCGLNAINFYLQQIFHTGSSASSSSNTYAVVITAVQTIVTGLAGVLKHIKKY